jgi:O-antigen/teichoic acid export membrane protein
MVLDKVSKLFRSSSDYRSQVAKLASGNVIAAIIPFLFQPVIARLYTAPDFSILGWFVSFISVLSVFATGKYELALILPRTDKDAKNLAFLSLSLSVIFSLVFIALSVSFYNLIASYVNTKEVFWIFLVGPGVFLYCSYQVFFYLANRYSLYNSMSFSKINQNAGMVGLQLALGLLGVGSIGLVFGRVFGYFISSLILGWVVLKFSPFRKQEISRSEIYYQSKAYSNFPKHLILSNLMAAIYAQLPFMYIARQFNSETAGQFAFAMQMITVPGILISNAIGDVFRQKASELYKSNGRFDNLLIKTLKNCFLFSLVPFTILILFSVPIFKVIFGNNWELAGKFASVLSIMTFIGFFISPIDKAAIVVNKTNFEFWYHLSRFIANILIIILAMTMSLSVFTYLYLLVLITVIHHTIDLIFSYRFSLASVNNEQ